MGPKLILCTLESRTSYRKDEMGTDVENLELTSNLLEDKQTLVNIDIFHTNWQLS